MHRNIVARFADLEAEASRARTEQSFLVSKAEIAANRYDLSIKRYKQVRYSPTEHLSTREVMARLRELEVQITKGLEELERIL